MYKRKRTTYSANKPYKRARRANYGNRKTYTGSKLETRTIEVSMPVTPQATVAQVSVKANELFPACEAENTIMIMGVQFTYSMPIIYGTAKFSCGGYCSQGNLASRNPWSGWIDCRNDKSKRMFYKRAFIRDNLSTGGITPLMNINDDELFYGRYIWFGEENIPQALKTGGIKFSYKLKVWYRTSPDLQLQIKDETDVKKDVEKDSLEDIDFDILEM